MEYTRDNIFIYQLVSTYNVLSIRSPFKRTILGMKNHFLGDLLREENNSLIVSSPEKYTSWKVKVT